jgi:hypothetical protein
MSTYGVASLLALPLAHLVPRYVRFAAGDVQLVRDTGFWGALLTWCVANAQHYSAGNTQTTDLDDGQNDLSKRQTEASLLLGLGGGLGLGLALATTTDFSLERVRAITTGGYGGMILGHLIAGMAAVDYGDGRGYTITSVGALSGLLLTAAFTGTMDQSDTFSGAMSTTLVPMVLAYQGQNGAKPLALGLRYAF